MEEDFTAFDFPELIQAPSINFDDPISLNSIDNESYNSDQSLEPENDNIAKIHEYLDRDLADQEVLIEKLKGFEAKIDKYLQGRGKYA